MNERIKQLALQSQLVYETTDGKVYNSWEDYVDLTEYVEKFAELIVRECLKQIKDGMVDESELLYEHEETTECVNEALMDAHHNIAIHFGFAKHFGVEND